ncbi:hypothetical protein PGB90_002745 [Kerria lacca]
MRALDSARIHCATIKKIRGFFDTLMKLKAGVKSKRRGEKKFTNLPILLHDNARPHMAGLSQSMIHGFGWEILDHPLYSTDLSPCDFGVFGSLKKYLSGTRFNDDEEVKQAVINWSAQLGADF